MSGQLSGHYGAMRHVCVSFFAIYSDSKQLLSGRWQRKHDNQLITCTPVNLHTSAGFRSLTSENQKHSFRLKPFVFLLQSLINGLKTCYTLFLYKSKACLSVLNGRLSQHGAIPCAITTCRSFAYFHFSCDRFLSKNINDVYNTDVYK